MASKGAAAVLVGVGVVRAVVGKAVVVLEMVDGETGVIDTPRTGCHRHTVVGADIALPGGCSFVMGLAATAVESCQS